MNIKAPYDQSLVQLNAAYVWLYFDRDRISLQDIKRIEVLPGVAESTSLRYNVQSRVRIWDTRAWVSLQAVPLGPPAVNRLLIREGSYLSHQQDEPLARLTWTIYRVGLQSHVGYVPQQPAIST
jgi:hypothetical protein